MCTSLPLVILFILFIVLFIILFCLFNDESWTDISGEAHKGKISAYGIPLWCASQWRKFHTERSLSSPAPALFLIFESPERLFFLNHRNYFPEPPERPFSWVIGATHFPESLELLYSVYILFSLLFQLALICFMSFVSVVAMIDISSYIIIRPKLEN